MPPSSAAMELKVLISIMQSGTALQTMMNQVNQLSQALTKLQAQAAAGGGGGGVPPSAPVLAGLNAIPPAAKAAEQSIQNIEAAINKVIGAVKFMTGGFLALQSIQFLKKLADDAAKVEVLTTVLHVVASNAGYTAEQIDEVDKSVQKLGITAAASKQALTSFLQARLPLTYAKDLARASQDLAVISDMNSSDTFKRLIVNIQQLDALGLRWMGIVVDRAAAEEKFKQKQEDTTKALNKRQQQEALMQEVLEKAKLLEGAYASAMGDVSKQLTSLERLTETYRAALGESLLPAYSNIVRVISTTLEKIILLSQQFSANRTRAKEWADAATVVADTFAYIILTLAEHIDQLVVLAKIYLAWRAAILLVNGAATGFVWITRAIVLINNMRMVLTAWQAGLRSVMVAWQMLVSTSTADATKIGAVAIAQARVAASQAAITATAPGAVAGITATGTAATVATAGISRLALAWGSIAAALAIPVVGYIIYKIQAQHEEEMKKPVLQRAAEVAEGSVLGSATAESIEKLMRMGRVGGEIREIYREWRKQIDDTGKSEEELRKQFAKSVAEYRKETPLIANASVLDDYKTKIGEVREEVTRLTTEGEQLRKMQLAAKDPEDKRAIGIERATIARQLESRQKKLSDLQKEMIKAAAERVPLAGNEAVFAQIEKYDAAQVRYDQIRETGTRKAVSHAQAEMDVEKAILEEMKKKIELRLKVEKLTDQERKQDEEALASIKARMTEVADRAERIRTSTETLFGSKFLFTPEGEVMGGQFAKEFGAFQQLVDDAREILEEEGAIPEQIAEKIKKGITALGQAAQQPVDLTKLKKTLEDVKGLGIPQTGALGRQAVGLAQLGVRQAQLAINAPLVTEGKQKIERFYAEQISAGETYLTKFKALSESETEVLEDKYRQNLVGIDEYFQARIDRVEKEAEAEREVQIFRLEEARALAAAEDPRNEQAVAAAARKVEAEERKLSEIGARAELERDRLQNQRAQRQRDFTSDISAQVAAQQAQAGGTKEALAQLELQLEQEAKRLAKDPRREELIALKRLTGEAEIYRKEREAAYQAEITILQVLQTQLDLQQKRIDASRALDQRLVARGEMTEHVAMQRDNARIYDEMGVNRQQQLIKERELVLNRNRLETEVAKTRERVADPALGLSIEEQNRQIALTQLEWTKAILETEGAIQDLDVAFANLALSAESYGARIRQTFISGFADALTKSITDFRNAGKVWVSLAESIGNEIVGTFIKAFTQRVFGSAIFSFVDSLMNRFFGGGNLPSRQLVSPMGMLAGAEGGMVSGPGTGTSDSIPIMVSTGEHIMPAAKTARFLPLLEGIRTGKILPFAKGGVVQSIAIPSVIPRRYASGGVVTTDGGASAVQPGGGGPSNMVVTMHPDTLNMTMREWLEHEVVRQQGRR